MAGHNANGEESVWLRKDGRWCAAVYLPVVRLFNLDRAT
jgi:hypothetical protein